LFSSFTKSGKWCWTLQLQGWGKGMSTWWKRIVVRSSEFGELDSPELPKPVSLEFPTGEKISGMLDRRLKYSFWLSCMLNISRYKLIYKRRISKIWMWTHFCLKILVKIWICRNSYSKNIFVWKYSLSEQK